MHTGMYTMNVWLIFIQIFRVYAYFLSLPRSFQLFFLELIVAIHRNIMNSMVYKTFYIIDIMVL